MLGRTVNLIELQPYLPFYTGYVSPQHSSHMNHPDISVVSYIKFLFIVESYHFFMFVSPALALGDKQVKYFFSLNSLTPYVCHILSSNNIFFYLFPLLSIFCLPGFFSSEIDQHLCLSNAAKQQNAALSSLCCWLHLPFLSWSHQQLLLTFLQDLSSDTSVTFCQTSSSGGDLLRV